MTPKQFAESFLEILEKTPKSVSREDLETNARILCRIIINFCEALDKFPVIEKE